ncbi:MAG: ComEC/Rec2 family competence protein [Planctomycetes bacterium]|nr:ComEC/Rec2 family competence protein [Planctomycetota bacterium]
MSRPPTRAPARIPARIVVAAACVATGILLAGPRSSLGPSSRPVFWPAWLGAAAALVGAVPARRHRVLRGVLMASAMTGVSAAWTTVRHDRAAATDLRTLTRGQAGVVRLCGNVVADPVTTDAATAVLARFHYRTSSTRFELDVDTALDHTGGGHRAAGRVLVRVAESVEPLNAGDRVRVTGMLLPPAAPRNPGTIDRRRTARVLGSAGLLRVPGRDMVVVERSGAHPFRPGRAALRREAERLLLADLPGGAGAAERDALLRAMLLGRRDASFGALHDAFRRVGLAHLLAISGLHLGVLVGLVMLVMRAVGAHRRGPQGLVVIVVVGAYLLLVEARLPVLRAGLMASAVGVGMIARRRWPTESLVLAAAMILLAWRPNELANPGFQLSFGVVLALLRGVPAVRRRWFPKPPGGAGTFGDVLADSVAGAWCVAVVAWAVATPIVLRHFGMLSPGTVPLSVVSLPVASVTLVLGYVKIIAGAVLPPAVFLLGPPLAWSSDLLRLLVGVADAIPGSVLHLPRPGTPWTIAALGWSTAWMTGLARRRRVLAAVAVVLVGWLAAPAVPWRGTPALRLDTLAVGNGSCHVVRADGRTLVFDAGSAADPDAGRRTILPALRAIGVRSIDVLCVSHPNLDHFSAVPEIAAQLAVGEVLVTPLLLEAARADPESAVAALLDDLRNRRVPVRAVAAGHRVTLGRATARWLHPAADARPENSNDGSMVVVVDGGGRRLLLTGDIETAGIDALLDHHGDLRADVMELPHHGSFSDAARRLVDRLHPEVVVQSTGPARLARDAWSGLPERTRRVVTARDGACRVVFPRDRRAPIEVGTWIAGTDTDSVRDTRDAHAAPTMSP